MKVLSFVLVCLLFSGICAADETVIDVSYSNRLLLNGEPSDTTFPEGGILATFVSNNPVTLLEPDSLITQVDDTTFTYVFTWDWDGAKSVDFVDALSETIQTVAWPEPVFDFDPTEHPVILFQIHTDSFHLWEPDSGLYVWGNNENCLQRGDDWECTATLDCYDGGVEPVFSEEIGLRVHGGISRDYDQKSLRIYFDDYGTSDQLVYPLYDEGPDSFGRLIFRTGKWVTSLLNCQIVEGIFMDLGHLGSRWRFMSLFLNDDYWGEYVLRERWDDEFIETTHNLENDDYILIRDGESKHGDVNEWNDLLDSFSDPADYSAHSFYTEIDSLLDLETYIDWVFFNIFFASLDNGFDLNRVLLKIRDEKWQFLMWDEETVFKDECLDCNWFRFYSSADSTDFEYWLDGRGWWPWTPERQKWCTMMNHFMQNAEFRERFSTRVDSLLTNNLSVASVTATLEEMRTDLLGAPSEYGFHSERWDASTSANWKINQYIDWVTTRHDTVTSQLAAFMDYSMDPVEFNYFFAEDADTLVDLVWRTERESDNKGFVLHRSVGVPDNMVEIASYLTHPELVGQTSSSIPTEYQFIDSSASINQVNYYKLHHVDLLDSVTVHEWVVSAFPTTWAGLVINELMADNESVITDEYSEYDDWFELYNGGSETIFLDSMYVTDDLGDPTKHRLTGNHSIPPGGYFLLWADSETLQGSRHCAFKLGSGGEEIGLFAPDGVTLLDAITFEEQFNDVSYARYPDGDLPWSYAFFATPGAANVEPGTEMLLVLNELMADNGSTIADEASDYDPWLEIFNPLPDPVDLNGLHLSDDSHAYAKWTFPDSAIAPGEHWVIWADNEPGEGPLHTNFAMLPAGGFLGFYRAGGVSIIDTVTYGVQSTDVSLARIPDGTGDWEETFNTTPGGINVGTEPLPTLFINEFLAKNDATNQDESGEYDDWVEIYNPGPDTVAMGGFFLTDDLLETTQWEFPDTTMDPESYLLVWCDDDTHQGPLHTTFKLSGNGEDVGLFARLDQGNLEIDSYQFGVQSDDISEGRICDGSENWVFFSSPTPEATNCTLTTSVPVAPAVPFGTVRTAPNPFNPVTRIHFSLPAPGRVVLSVYSLSGHLVRDLHDGVLERGEHSILWDGRNNSGEPVGSGVYFARMKSSRGTSNAKMLLLK